MLDTQRASALSPSELAPNRLYVFRRPVPKLCPTTTGHGVTRMAISGSSSSSQQQPYQGADARRDHAVLVRWSGIVGGTVLGWGIFSLLTLVGTAIGFAKFD